MGTNHELPMAMEPDDLPVRGNSDGNRVADLYCVGEPDNLPVRGNSDGNRVADLYCVGEPDNLPVRGNSDGNCVGDRNCHPKRVGDLNRGRMDDENCDANTVRMGDCDHHRGTYIDGEWFGCICIGFDACLHRYTPRGKLPLLRKRLLSNRQQP